MGFTIEDMLTLTGDRYQMSMIAGSRGWSNSISWVLMVEDFTILRNFVGKELAVTMGMGFESQEKLLTLIRQLSARHAAGLIINTEPKAREQYYTNKQSGIRGKYWLERMKADHKDDILKGLNKK